MTIYRPMLEAVSSRLDDIQKRIPEGRDRLNEIQSRLEASLESLRSQYEFISDASILAAKISESESEKRQIIITQNILSQLDDAVLYAWAHDDQKIGSKLAFNRLEVPETTLKTLAVYEWSQRKNKKERKRETIRWIIPLIITSILGAGGWVVAFFK